MLTLHVKYTQRYNNRHYCLTCTFYIRSIPLCVPGTRPSSSLNLEIQNRSEKFKHYYCKFLSGYFKRIKWCQDDSTVGDL